MKPKFWQTKEFREIEKKWYEKLEEKGFTDIEEAINGKRTLRQRASNCYRQEHEVRRIAKTAYYDLLCEAIHLEENFRDEVEKLIMQRRASGVTVNAISEELKSMRKRCHVVTVWRVIQKYEKKWRIRKK